MPKICFAINEIAPLTSGGAGMLIFHLVRELLQEQIEVILLLDVDEKHYADFEVMEGPGYPNNHLLKTYHLGSLCKKIPYNQDNFISRYLWESYRYHWGLQQIEKTDHPDVVEFVDFCGPAYYSLCSKLFGLHHQGTQIAVRIHGPISLIDQYTAGKPLDFDRYCIYALEKQSIKLADVILYPSDPILEIITSNFKPWRGTSFCAPPPLHKSFAVIPKNGNANTALFYGRLYREKGADKFIRAAVELLDSSDTNLSFYLIGADSEPPVGTIYSSYSDFLRAMVPEKYTDRFKFTGHLRQQQVKELLPNVKFAVFPSTFETFGYAAQEIYQSGTPIIVSSIPAFQDKFNGLPDVFFFDGSVGDLSEKMALLDTAIKKSTTNQSSVTREKSDSVSFYLTARKPDNPLISDGPVSNVLVVILDDAGNAEDLRRTEESLVNLDPEIFSIVYLTKASKTQGGAHLIPLFGDYYSLGHPQNRSLESQNVVTRDAIFLLRAGDEIQLDFLIEGNSAFSNHSNLVQIGGWAEIHKSNKRWLHNQPVAAMPELVPFETVSNHLRVLFRTKANIRLEDLFDQESGNLGECDLLWSEQVAGRLRIDVPQVFFKQSYEPTNNMGNPALSYLINKYSRTGMASGLVKYLTLLANGFPKRQFPLQNYWARKSGLPFGIIKKQSFDIFTGYNLRDVVYSQLATGGSMQLRLLKFLRRVAGILRTSRRKR